LKLGRADSKIVSKSPDTASNVAAARSSVSGNANARNAQ